MPTELYRTAQFLWIGQTLSPIERLALASFRDHKWRTVLYAYQPISNVPDGIDLADANDVVDESQIFEDRFFDDAPGKTYTTFADLFRLALLARFGGWWFDMDMVAVRGPKRYAELDRMLVGSTWEMHWKECAINCAMFAPPSDPAIIVMRDDAFALVQKPALTFGETGPHLVQRIVREKALQDRVAPFWEFCPYPWRQIGTTCFRSNRELASNSARLIKHLLREQIDPNFRAGWVRPATTAVHLHNEIWRRSGISKSGPFHPLSFVGRALHRHGSACP